MTQDTVVFYVIAQDNGDPDTDEHPILEAAWDTREEAQEVLNEHWSNYGGAYVLECEGIAGGE